MPVDYKLRNLRRLFGEASFLRPAGREAKRPARRERPASASGAGAGNAAAPAPSSSPEGAPPDRARRPKSAGGVPRAFFAEQPPRSMRNKAVGGQLYSVHLFEKQKIKLYYGALGDSQFKRYVDRARAKRLNTDAELLRMLELRLDTFLYRTGFVKTPMQGRQWVSHKQILVNGRLVNIKSAAMRVGDVMEVRDRHRPHAYTAAREVAEMRKSMGLGSSWILGSTDPAGMVPWMEIDREGLAAVLVREPTDEEARALARAALFPFVKDANLNPHSAMRAYR